MKNFYNAVCSRCTLFRPRCASVHFRDGQGKYRESAESVCNRCRFLLRGKFRLAAVHKGATP